MKSGGLLRYEIHLAEERAAKLLERAAADMSVMFSYLRAMDKLAALKSDLTIYYAECVRGAWAVKPLINPPQWGLLLDDRIIASFSDFEGAELAEAMASILNKAQQAHTVFESSARQARPTATGQAPINKGEPMQYESKGFIAPNPKLNATLADAEFVQARLSALGIPTVGIFANGEVSGGALEAPYAPVADLLDLKPDTRVYLQIAQQNGPSPADVRYHDVSGLKEDLQAGIPRTLEKIFEEFYPGHGKQAMLTALFYNADIQKIIDGLMKGSAVQGAKV